jgi:hypothetical protein
MNFLYPNTLWFLLLLSIPILIHLFHFRRHKKIYFSSLRFLQSFQKEKKAVKKLQNVIILCLRLIALGFLILAFAQPAFNENGINDSDEPIISLYIDNSYSMSAKGFRGELLSEAKETAKEFINSNPKDQRYTISSNDLGALQKRILNAKDAQIEIDKLQYTPLQRTFSSIFNWHNDLKIEAANKNKALKFNCMFLSDFQKDFFDISSIKKDPETNLNIWQFAPQKIENCFIDSLWFGTKTHRVGEDSELFFRLNNTGSETLVNFEVKVTANTFSKDLFIDLPKKGTVISSVTIPNKQKSFVNGKIELQDQSIFWDDDFFFCFQNSTESKVLIINGKDAVSSVNKAFNTEAFFKITETDIQRVNQSALYQQQLVVLNGIRNISSGLRADLLKFKKNGGLIFILPSIEVDINQMNPLLKALDLPVIEGLKEVNLKANNLALKDPIFKGVFEDQEETLNLPSFKKLFKSNYKQTTALPLLSLRDESPVLFRSLDNSFVLFSGLDENCSDLIQNTLFPVLCIRIAETAGNSSLPYHYIGQSELIPFEKSLGGDGPVKLQNTTTDFIPKIIQEGSYNYLDISGIEAMENLSHGNYFLNQNEPAKTLSLNYSRLESSTKYMPLVEIKKQLLNAGLKNIKTEFFNEKTDITSLKIDNNNEYWRICIFITVLAIFCEILIAKFWKN